MKSSEKTGSNAENSAVSLDRRICVAPMMDYTDRHFRFLLRLLSPSALLYTEMIHAQAIVRGATERLLAFDNSEHPVALQLGGSEPYVLAQAAKIASDYGYDEINLNCGCPSDRVQSGRFGACLMDEPARVAECVAAMASVVDLPITVKCRIGIEPTQKLDEYDALCEFVATVSAAGCNVFIVHARKAILQGLSPKQNREIPPLRYDIAARLPIDFPKLTFVVNGGIQSDEQALLYLQTFSGVMLGREICQNPYRLAELHRAICAPTWSLPSRESVLASYLDYVRLRFAEGQRLAPMLRHVLALYTGMPCGRSWRRFLSERAHRADTTPDVLLESMRIVS